MNLNENRRLVINGIFQHVTIMAEEKDLPLLVFVHGGPGDGALPLILRYQSELARHFTLVIWEQRGAGKSFYEFGVHEKVEIADYIGDLHELIEYLLKRFKQKKVYLWGHDFGTIIGLRYIMEYPDTVKMYIACSQVVNMEKAMRLRLRYAIENSPRMIANKLLKIDPTFSGDHAIKDLALLDKQITRLKGNLYDQKSTVSLQHIYLRCPAYTMFDYQRYRKGIAQSIEKLWPEIMTVNFESITHFAVPVLFVEGRNDKRLSSALAKTYFDKITSEKQWVWFEQSSHYPQWCEPQAFNTLMIDLLSQERK